jgi:hypothetical protein
LPVEWFPQPKVHLIVEDKPFVVVSVVKAPLFDKEPTFIESASEVRFAYIVNLVVAHNVVAFWPL